MNINHYKFWPARIPHELVYPRVPLFEFLDTSARRYPESDAIVYYGTRISYLSLLNAVEKLAGELHGMGVRKGDRVALYLQNSPHFIISFFGVMRANAIVVPVNPMLTERELKFVLEDSGSIVLITTSDFYSRAAGLKDKTLREIIVGDYADYLPESAAIPVPAGIAARGEISGDAILWQDLLNRANQPAPAVEVGPEDLAMLPYTSGSTGIPKGCMHTHATIISNTVSSAVWHSNVAGSNVMATLPLFHVTGLIHSMLAPIYAGGTVVLLSRWDREAAITAIEKYRCSLWTNITTMVVDLLNHPDIARRDLSSLAIIGGGGAPMPGAVAQKLFEITGLRYLEGYGMTETISQTHLNPPDRPKMQCIGIPDFGVDARIIDIESGEELPPGKVGELIVSGPEIMVGYWNRPGENAESFIEKDCKRFLRTGDICRMDDEGYFYIVDRSKRMINAAGFKVWPTEVEAVLYGHPAISEVCVVGTPDPVRVENVKAFIVLRDQYRGKVTDGEIIAWAKENMAAYRYPRVVEFVDQLPKSGTGKILWKELQQMEKEKACRA